MSAVEACLGGGMQPYGRRGRAKTISSNSDRHVSQRREIVYDLNEGGESYAVRANLLARAGQVIYAR